jgi:hypothetical protein
MRRSPLRFRIYLAGTWYVRVLVADTKADMWRALEACHGERHQHELAATVYSPGSPERGCVADMFFYWRGLRPSTIAHEAAHGAYAVAVAMRQRVGAESDEHIAKWVEMITEKIWLRTQSAAL